MELRMDAASSLPSDTDRHYKQHQAIISQSKTEKELSEAEQHYEQWKTDQLHTLFSKSCCLAGMFLWQYRKPKETTSFASPARPGQAMQSGCTKNQPGHPREDPKSARPA